ncbi:hypothetical protein ACN47E_008549 [Coniothyrium glycines]
MGSDNATERWDAYANGGIQAEDRDILSKRRAQATNFSELIRSSTPVAGSSPGSNMKLIEISPAKQTASKNASLLIDLDVSVDAEQQYPSHDQRASYAAAVSSSSTAKRSQEINLLD